MNQISYQIDTPEMQFAIGFALQAGKLMRDKFTFDVVTEWKNDNTPITEADKMINEQFIEQVARQFPGYSILGEEASKPVKDAEWAWVIDPIDGTGPFVQGMPLSTCCISLLHNGIPELGVIYDPILDRLFYAQKGRGAFMNELKITVSTATSLERGFVYLDTLRTGDRRLLPLRQTILEAGATPQMINAIQYCVALTCAGRAAGVVFTLKSNWDAAAGYAIGTEAGALVTDLQGKPQRYDQPTNGFILAAPAIHEQLLAMVEDCYKAAEN